MVLFFLDLHYEGCFDYTVAIPKEMPTYSADFAGLQIAFKGVVQSWVEQFQSEFDTLCKKKSDRVSTKAQEQVNIVFHNQMNN